MMVPTFDQAYIRKVGHFEHRMRRRLNQDWLELCTIYVQVSQEGTRYEFWKEKGVKANSLYMMPSTYLMEKDILVARNRIHKKGKLVACEVSFFESDLEIAKEVAINALENTIEDLLSDVTILRKELLKFNLN